MSSATDHVLTHPHGSLHYRKAGQGNKALLLFHGFGQSSRSTAHLDVLSKSHVLYHFDLPHHGLSQWSAHTIEKETVKSIFLEFLSKEKADRFSLAAFSLGGKMLITLLEIFPERVEQLILIAPDGIRTNFWYQLATKNRFYRKLFKYIVDHPEFYFRSVALMKALGFLDRSITRFVISHMDTLEKREQVYRVWNAFKRLHLEQQLIIKTINDHRVKVFLYLGIYDRVIPKSKFSRFIGQTKELQYFAISSGHNDLIKIVSQRIENDLSGASEA